MKKLKNMRWFLLVAVLLTTMVACNNSNDDDIDWDNPNVDEVISLEEPIEMEQEQTMGNTTLILLIIAIIILGPGTILFFYYFVPLKLWYEAYLSGVKISWWRLIIMRWQGIPQPLILHTLIKAKNAGVTLTAKRLGDHYLAEVDIETVVNTLIRAHNANMSIELDQLAMQFLAKVDVEKVMHAIITAKNAGIEVTLPQLSSYFLAEVDVVKIVEGLVTAHNAGYDEMTLEDLKEHYLANGDIEKTIDAFVAAKKAHLPNFTFKDVAAIDLAGLDVISAIDSAITPRVVETVGVTGVARDGVQLTMKVKVTLRAYIKNIIGGSSEETVLARVDEALGTEIGRAKSHYDVLENPFELADRVEQQNLHKGSAFEIISVDVSDIVIGRDIHAELLIERSRADAEKAKAEVIKAQEKVQKAMAAAFLDGNLTVQQYHEFNNTQADTAMREALGRSANPPEDEHDNHSHNKEKK